MKSQPVLVSLYYLATNRCRMGSLPVPLARLLTIKRQMSAVPASESALIKSESKNALRVLILNRPKALNSLNVDMMHEIHSFMKKWSASDLVACVLMRGNGRAFCSGGDVKAATQKAYKDDTRQEAVDFFRVEYETDNFIANMKKPVVTFMTGYTSELLMGVFGENPKLRTPTSTVGGGVGLSAHAAFRVATENTKFAMPEAKIGLFPDVGVAFRLARMDGSTGLYLALTSETITGYDCYRLGIATHYITSDRLAKVEERLAELEPANTSTPAKYSDLVNTVLDEYQADEAEVAKLTSSFAGSKRKAIDHCFAKDNVVDILKELRAIEEGAAFEEEHLQEWARMTRETIEHRSPTSCTVALLAFQRAKRMSIDEVFQMDMQLAATCLDPNITTDFIRGVDVVLGSDKSRRNERPEWIPSTVQEISLGKIEKDFFSPDSPTKLPVPTLRGQKSSSYKSYPHEKYELPSETTIGSVVQGTYKDSGSFAITSHHEVYDIIKKRWPNKTGLNAKIEDVLERRTIMKDNALKWNY